MRWCGKCTEVCPTNAIKLNASTKDDKIKIDRELCTLCEKCLHVCYTGALDLFYCYITVDELFDIVKKDEQYYRSSGGGVTIGGGDPSFQPLFTLAFLRKCQENYIHTAVDTCGYTQSAEAFRVLEEADLLLYDIKGMDLNEHLYNTGVSNKVILSNLERLDARRKPSIIRLPIIPGYNDSSKSIKATAEFLARLKCVERVDILAYHEYGKIKYEQLGKEYKLHVQSPADERISEIKAILERYGLKVQIGG